MNGAAVALMGIDGSGKSTLSGALGEALREAGYRVVTADWQDNLRQPDALPSISYEQMCAEYWRLLFAGMQVAGERLDRRIPRVFGPEMVSSSFVDVPPGATVEGARPSGLLGSAMVEFLMDYMLQSDIVVPARLRGDIALSDGFGFKSMAKKLMLTREVALRHGGLPDEVLVTLLDFARSAYASSYLQPDIGIFLDVDPATSYARIVRRGGGVGLTEDLRLAGRTGRESYLELQSLLAEEYAARADAWGWHVIRAGERAPDDVAREGVGLVLDLLSVRNR
ncbi:dTMP kinase [Streptomyces sp. NRRL F-5123]|uniref:dTMP kinase n=1 Tax=Streptomyces sp. NRRL F-5123 TaxID=1463856 RepID=UPI0004E2743D|nr:hypothetical protein [Streptomyces sp. NRRL F-5123]